VAHVLVLLVLLTSVGTAACDPGDAADDCGPGPVSAALEVFIAEMPDAVRLHIQASEDVEAGSVEVRFSGRKMVVLARDAEGRPIRSQSLRLPEPVVEEGSSGEYDADGSARDDASQASHCRAANERAGSGGSLRLASIQEC
jgi:hypothetical protein